MDLVRQISIPRFPGSRGAQRVRSLMTDRFQEIGMRVYEQSFYRCIRGQEILFTNLIATNMERGSPDVVLIAHADTLDGYEGAMDAAASMVACYELAKGLRKMCRLMVALVDGEEAYPPHKWSVDTAMSGSLHLAETLAKNQCVPRHVIVLDLVGGSRHDVYRYNRDADAASRRLFLECVKKDRELFPHARPLFVFEPRMGRTQNDSWPFMQNRVYRCVLDIMPYPFPPQWHQRGVDVWSNVDMTTYKRVVSILMSVIMSSCCSRVHGLDPENVR